MNKTNIEIELGQDAYDVFLATRLYYCVAYGCKYHSMNDARCELRKIAIKENGQCEKYDPGGAG